MLSSRRPIRALATAPTMPMLRMPPATRTARGATTSRFTTRPFQPLWITTLPASTSPVATTRPSWIDGPSITRGPFVVVAREAARNSFLSAEDLNGAPRRSMRVVLQLLADPKLLVYSVSNRVQVEVAVDAEGNSLVPAQPREQGTRQSYSARDWIWMIDAELTYPTKPAARLARLRGTLTAAVVTRSESITLTKLDEAVGQFDAADVRLIFGKLEKNVSSRQSRLSLMVPRMALGGEGWDELRTLLSNESLIEATDATGRRLIVNVQWRRQSETAIEGDLMFRGYQEDGDQTPRPSVPAKIVWNIPIEVTDVPIPVEFADLPLP
jgi:hypothetical protein